MLEHDLDQHVVGVTLNIRLEKCSEKIQESVLQLVEGAHPPRIG